MCSTWLIISIKKFYIDNAYQLISYQFSMEILIINFYLPGFNNCWPFCIYIILIQIIQTSSYKHNLNYKEHLVF